MFGRMNALLQDSIIGKNLNEIHPELPTGIVDSQEGFLRSIPVPGATDCYISGRFDILSKLDDGTYSIIDFKITNPDEEQIKKFSSQLHAYKFALENPADGNPIVISKMGLISINPDTIENKDGKFIFSTTPKWFPIDEDMDSFYSLISDIQTVLNGELPPSTTTCALCTYRSKFEPKKSIPLTDEIPF